MALCTGFQYLTHPPYYQYKANVTEERNRKVKNMVNIISDVSKMDDRDELSVPSGTQRRGHLRMTRRNHKR